MLFLGNAYFFLKRLRVCVCVFRAQLVGVGSSLPPSDQAGFPGTELGL